MNKDRNQRKLSEKTIPKNDYREEKRTPLDKYKDQKFVDDIPLQDLNIEMKQEKQKHKTQNNSQSKSKYQADFDQNEE